MLACMDFQILGVSFFFFTILIFRDFKRPIFSLIPNRHHHEVFKIFNVDFNLKISNDRHFEIRFKNSFPGFCITNADVFVSEEFSFELLEVSRIFNIDSQIHFNHVMNLKYL